MTGHSKSHYSAGEPRTVSQSWDTADTALLAEFIDKFRASRDPDGSSLFDQSAINRGIYSQTILLPPARTIGDHGRCHICGKQFLYDGGIRIPMIFRGPDEKVPRPVLVYQKKRKPASK